MKYTLLFLLILILFSVSGQKHPDTLINSANKAYYTDQTHIKLQLQDTLKLKTISEQNNEVSFWREKMPWLSSLFIALVSVLANVFLARFQRKTSIKSLREEFKATINSKNRQDWIIELRNALSEFLSTILVIKSNQIISHTERKEYVDKIFLSKMKILLLTNEKKQEQIELNEAVDNLMNEIFILKTNNQEVIKKARNDVVEKGRILISRNWEKIKNLEQK